MITVQFAENHGVKKFLCPAAVGAFLTFCSSALQETMDAELEQIRVQKELERKQHEEEVARQREEERKALLKLKRAAAKKRTPAKTTKKTLVINKTHTQPDDGNSIGCNPIGTIMIIPLLRYAPSDYSHHVKGRRI